MPHRGLRVRSPSRMSMNRVALLAVVVAVTLAPQAGGSADLPEARALAGSGEYEEALRLATEAVEANTYGEDWRILKADLELLLGRYEAARVTCIEALQKYTFSVRLHWRLREAHRFCGHAELAADQMKEITRLVESSPWRFTDSDNLLMLGEIALDAGADAREVQEAFFQRARRTNPRRPEPLLALANLALDKRDFQLAAQTFRQAAEAFPDHADVQYGLAAALAGSDSEAATAALRRALELNPRHIPSLLLQADQQIDAEQYGDAELTLRTVLKINAKHPAALAYWAAIEHLRNNPQAEEELRNEALSTWSSNPEVDYLIGRELSQKYRFAEGAAHQRTALKMGRGYQPALKQLATDLLRLGREEEGWRLADAAFQADAYDVAMFNLVTLRDELEQFRTLEEGPFLVRMEAIEADVYGTRVMQLLESAHDVLCTKYGLELEEPVTVEIFPDPDDFAVRTFGLPGASGYLGVCFGNVITANSPAAQLQPSNWESVLWHEFAHVVTLNLTRNRMPRWLSEGISVYEERQAHGAWGERMDPTYRSMVLGGELTPIGELSGAFLAPKSAAHVMFAYYESSMVVEYIIEEFGFEAVLQILDDLRDGVLINDAIERHTVPLDELDAAFSQFIRERAEQLAPGVDWSRPDVVSLFNSPLSGVAVEAWLQENPANLAGLIACGEYFLRNEEWEQARRVLQQAHDLYPQQTGPESAAVLLAEVHRMTGETEAERSVLTEYAAIDPDAVSSCLRLMEIDTAREDWEGVRRWSQQALAVNPLIPQPHRALADAAERLGDNAAAIKACRALLALAPDDPAGLHYRLAKLWHAEGDAAAARRHVLLALEEAPRFRDAHTLLLKLVREREEAPVDERETTDSPAF